MFKLLFNFVMACINRRLSTDERTAIQLISREIKRLKTDAKNIKDPKKDTDREVIEHLNTYNKYNGR